MNELNYLLANIALLENQLSRYSIAQNDVISYVTNAIGSELYLQPRHDASSYVFKPYSMIKLEYIFVNSSINMIAILLVIFYYVVFHLSP